MARVQALILPGQGEEGTESHTPIETDSEMAVAASVLLLGVSRISILSPTPDPLLASQPPLSFIPREPSHEPESVRAHHPPLRHHHALLAVISLSPHSTVAIPFFKHPTQQTMMLLF